MSHNNNRRNFFKIAAAATAGIALPTISKADSIKDLPQTPGAGYGPYFPGNESFEKTNDLITAGVPLNNLPGKLIYVQGVVKNENMEPIKNAIVQIWQNDSLGRYKHPTTEGDLAPLDPRFKYYGMAKTGEDGTYNFRTIMPTPYPGDDNWVRCPHIHFHTVATGFYELVSQMFFAGHPLNSGDRVFKSIPTEVIDRCEIDGEEHTTPSDGDVQVYRFDMVLVSR